VNESTTASGDGSETPSEPGAIEGSVEERVLESLPNAESEEAAAIAAAIGTYLRGEELAAASERTDRGWDEPGRRWAFAGRMRGLGGRTDRMR
jgi:hypothetical protein